MSALSVLGSTRYFDTSDDDSDNDGKSAKARSQLSLNSAPANELSNQKIIVSVTVKKVSTTQKAGIGLVERKQRVYISSITENGLFHGTQCEVGDVILAVNGNRVARGQGAREVMLIITQTETNVTFLLRKKQKNARSLSLSTRRSRSKQKITLREAKQGESSERYVGKSSLRIFMLCFSIIYILFLPSSLDSEIPLYKVRNADWVTSSECTRDSGELTEEPGLDPVNDATNTSNQTANITESSSEHPRSTVEHMEPSSPPATEATRKKSKSSKVRTKATGDVSKSPGAKPKKYDKRSTSVREMRSSMSDEITPSKQKRRSSSIADFPTNMIPGKFNTQSLSPEKRRSYSRTISGAKHSVSVDFDYNRIDGDFIKITVKKGSDSKSGILIEKVDGKFVLVALPLHEKRNVLGMQVLAINGQSTFHTASKAIEIVNQTEHEVQLVLDFSSGFDGTLTSPFISSEGAVQDKINKDTGESSAPPSAQPTSLASPLPPPPPPPPPGAETAGGTSNISPGNGTVALNISSRKIAYRKVDPNSDRHAGGAEELMSLAQSERTFKVTNRAPPGSRRVPRIKRPPKYHVDEFDSDSDG